MRLFNVLILVIMCVLVALFTVSNMEPLTLRLNLIFPDGVEAYASVWILLSVGAGMVLGMIFGWWVGAEARVRHRKTQAENRRLTKQVASLTQLTAAGGSKEGGEVAGSTLPSPKPSQKPVKKEMG